jgi:GR25 family glycosyltransferase involved in LPS biosynthesis
MCSPHHDVINLDRRPDMWWRFETRNASFIEECGITRYSAQDGQRLPREEEECLLKRGEMGVARSHLDLWERACDDAERDWSVILEDDTVLADTYTERLHTVLRDADINCAAVKGGTGGADLVWLDRTIWRGTGEEEAAAAGESGEKLTFASLPSHGMHLYAVSRHGACDLARDFRAADPAICSQDPLDVWVSRYISERPHVEFCAVALDASETSRGPLGRCVGDGTSTTQET